MNEISDDGPLLPIWLPLAGAIVLLSGLFIGYHVYKVDRQIGAAIMTGSVVPAALAALQYIRLFRALGRATLQMKDEVIPLGWSGSVTYVRPLRGATVRSVEARLQCEEHVERGGGKSRREWRKLVVDEPLAPQGFPALEQLSLQIHLKVPASGPPTFHYTDNEINWWVRLRLTMDGCPNTRSSFKLTVLPTVMAP